MLKAFAASAGFKASRGIVGAGSSGYIRIDNLSCTLWAQKNPIVVDMSQRQRGLLVVVAHPVFQPGFHPVFRPSQSSTVPIKVGGQRQRCDATHLTLDERFIVI
jgi:hypothetical protein